MWAPPRPPPRLAGAGNSQLVQRVGWACYARVEASKETRCGFGNVPAGIQVAMRDPGSYTRISLLTTL